MLGRSELAAEYIRDVPNAFKYNGVTLPGWKLSVERLLAVEELKFGPKDVIVTSYPKCGTTWLTEIVSCVLHDGNLEIVKTTKNRSRVPLIEFDFDILWDNDSLKPEIRPFYTHLPWGFLPATARQGECKLIHISRNPKDVAVSFYHFHRMNVRLGRQTWSWDKFLQFFNAGEVVYGSWFDHQLDFYTMGKDKGHILFIKYEDLIENFHSELDKICTFLDKKLSEEAKASIKEHCQFNSMQNNPMTNGMTATFFDQDISKFVRKVTVTQQKLKYPPQFAGVVGDWKNYFTAEQSVIFYKIYQERMTGSGLEFDFDLN